jgi:hypothetical protein
VLNDSVQRDVNGGHALEDRLVQTRFRNIGNRFDQRLMAAIEM